MAYIDKAYVLTQIKQAELNNLTADDAGVPQDSYLTEKINAADTLINGYLKKVVVVLPLDPVPDIIKQYSYSIALFYLHGRIQYSDIPKHVKDIYDATIFSLKDISKGESTLYGVEADNEQSQIDYDVDPNIMNRNMF